MICRHCTEPIMAPFKFHPEYVEHICCLKDAEMSHTHDHRAEPDKRINTQPINTEEN